MRSRTTARLRRAVGELLERIDAFLAYCFEEWAAIPEIAEEWETWSDGDRLEFALEWPIREDRLKQLGGWAKQDSSRQRSGVAMISSPPSSPPIGH